MGWCDLEKKIPHLKLWYLRGLFEADGCVKVNLKFYRRKDGTITESTTPELQLLSEHKHSADLFAEVLGGKVYAMKRGYFEWRVLGEKAVDACGLFLDEKYISEKSMQMKEVHAYPRGMKGRSSTARELKEKNHHVRTLIRDKITNIKKNDTGIVFNLNECTSIERDAFVAGFLDGDGTVSKSGSISFCQKRSSILQWILRTYPGGRLKEKYAKCKGKVYGPFGFLTYSSLSPHRTNWKTFLKIQKKIGRIRR